MRLASLLSKVEEIRVYCDDQADSCTDVEGENYVAENKAMYATATSELSSAISAYYSTALNQAREKQLHELILTLYQTDVMSYLSIKDEGIDLIEVDPSTAPLGYTDFSLLFDMGQFATDFLAAPVEGFWDGCVVAPILEPEEAAPTLYTAIGGATAAEGVDAQARTTLINWAKLTNITNSFIFLFEEVTTSDNRPQNLKQAIGESMFTTKKAAELIRYYGFDIRIPSYIP